MKLETLKTLAAAHADRHILDLFAADPKRASRFSATAGDMLFDYSKTGIDDDIRDALIGLCDEAGLDARRAAMFAGEKINETEDRAVLHTALRNLDGGAVHVDGRTSCRTFWIRCNGCAFSPKRFAEARQRGQGAALPISSISALAGPIWGR